MKLETTRISECLKGRHGNRDIPEKNTWLDTENHSEEDPTSCKTPPGCIGSSSDLAIHDPALQKSFETRRLKALRVMDRSVPALVWQSFSGLSTNSPWIW
jgi:hypothetical protein